MKKNPSLIACRFIRYFSFSGGLQNNPEEDIAAFRNFLRKLD